MDRQNCPNRPYTFIVLALLILIVSPIVIFRTPTDIFPNIDIPVVAVAWTYTGLSPEEMEGRITTVYERVLTTTVDNIEHIESTTINGTAIVKIYPAAGRQRRSRECADYRRLADYSPPIAAGRPAAVHPQLQRLHGSDSSTGISGKNLTEPQLNELR